MTHFQWDNLDRITGQMTEDLVHAGSPTVHQVFSYEGAGNLLWRQQYRVDAHAGTLERTLLHDIDHLGRRTRTVETDGQGAVVFASDFGYDRRGLMTDTNRFDANGAVQLVSVSSFDDAGWRTSLTHGEPASVGSALGDLHARYVYGRDAAGRITSIDSLHDGQIGYDYDAAGPLWHESHDGVVIESNQKGKGNG